MSNLLDTLLTNGVQQSAPNVKPFQMGEFLTNAGQLKNVNESMNELDRQNSIRNLIAQREKEGIPFEQLSDEIAKYNLDTAIKARNEARTSQTWNRQESEAELANHKKYMAGWLGGKVLRRAQAEVASGNAQWDIEYVVNVCNEAASVIYPYDPEGARALINYANGLLGKKTAADAKQKPKKFEDDIKHLNNVRSNLLNIQSNNKNDDIRKIASAELYRLDLLEQEIGGRSMPVYAWMPGFLKKNFNKRNGYMDAINMLIQNYDWTRPNRLEYDVDKSGDSSDLDKINSATGGKISYSPVLNKDENTVDENSPRKYSFVNTEKTGLGRVYEKIEDAYSAISDAITNAREQDLDNLAAAIDEFKNTEGAAHTDNIDRQLAAKRKYFEDLHKKEKEDDEIYGKGASNAFKQAFDRMLKSARTATALNSQMTAFHGVTQGIATQSPLTLINNALVTMLPFYKPTDYDAKSALQVTNSIHSVDDWLTYVAAAGFPIISDFARVGNFDAAVDAILKDVSSTMKGYLDNALMGLEGKAREELFNEIVARWNLSDMDISIMLGEPFPVGDVRKAMAKEAQAEYEKRYVDRDGNVRDSKTNKILKTHAEIRKTLHLKQNNDKPHPTHKKEDDGNEAVSAADEAINDKSGVKLMNAEEMAEELGF